MFRKNKKVKGISQEQIDKIMHSDAVNIKVSQKAVEVQTFWKSIAPVFDRNDPREHRKEPKSGKPGDYRDSVIVKNVTDADGIRWRVKPTDFKSKWIEFGTKNEPEHALVPKVMARYRKP